MESLDRKYLALVDAAEREDRHDAEGMRLCFEILALAAAIDRSCAARLAAHRLSEGRFVLLVLLRDLPGGLAPHELANRAGVTRATITGLLDGLERDGLVARRGDADDRRRVSVRLTAKGRATAHEVFEEHGRWIGSLVAGLGQSDREVFGNLLRRVRGNVEGPQT